MQRRSQGHLRQSVHRVQKPMEIVRTFVVREVVLHRAHGKLLLEPIDLVQEQNYAGLDEPPGIANAVEKSESLLHTVDSLIFEQKLIVFRDGDQEQNGGDIFEAVDPLLSF